MSNWKRSAKSHACNTFPTVWGAIVGCTGRGNSWRYIINGSFGRGVEYACPTCLAARNVSEALIGQAHQDLLRALQDAANVKDYRTAKARRINGVPTLVQS